MLWSVNRDHGAVVAGRDHHIPRSAPDAVAVEVIVLHGCVYVFGGAVIGYQIAPGLKQFLASLAEYDIESFIAAFNFVCGVGHIAPNR